METNDIREKLKVENITERCKYSRLVWLGLVKRGDQNKVEEKHWR